MPSSPTHAAHTLASIAQHQVLSAESICPWPVLQLLVDDYFTFVHPLVPVPHEPTFRAALQQRQDMSNQMFLALLASMVGCLAASFPRRHREHLRAHNLGNLFSSPMGLVERCHKVAIEAQNPVTFNREHTVHDAILSYLQGMTSEYTGNRPASLLYFKQSLSIVTTLGLHRDSMATSTNGAPPSRMTPNGQILRGPQQRGGDLLTQELERRLFWSLFVGVKSMHQHGVSPSELNIPPATRLEPYPPLPLEVDDAYLTSTIVLSQPEDSTPEIAGFNANVRIFRTYDTLSTTEYMYGVGEVFDWERQKADLERSLYDVKKSLESLPSGLHLSQQDLSVNPTENGYVSPNPISLHSLHMGPQTDDIFGATGRLHIHQAIQKTHIHANQISTRSYLIQKYFSLSSAHQRSSVQIVLSPTLNSPHLDHNNVTSTSVDDTMFSDEHRASIRDCRNYLQNTSRGSLEASGVHHIHNIRQILSRLLATQKHEDSGSFSPKVAEAERYLHHKAGELSQLYAAVRDGAGLEQGDEEPRLQM